MLVGYYKKKKNKEKLSKNSPERYQNLQRKTKEVSILW